MKHTLKTLACTLATGLAFALPANAESHAMKPVKHGDHSLSHPFAFATLPNAPVAGGFITIQNTGTADDRLVSASSPVSAETQIHEMAMDNGVMKMRELPTGLPLPAGATTELKPGGYHVMFMKLQQPLVDGETVPVTLTFEKAGPIEMTFPIKKRGGKMHKMKHSDTDTSMPKAGE